VAWPQAQRRHFKTEEEAKQELMAGLRKTLLSMSKLYPEIKEFAPDLLECTKAMLDARALDAGGKSCSEVLRTLVIDEKYKEVVEIYETIVKLTTCGEEAAQRAEEAYDRHLMRVYSMEAGAFAFIATIALFFFLGGIGVDHIAIKASSDLVSLTVPGGAIVLFISIYRAIVKLLEKFRSPDYLNSKRRLIYIEAKSECIDRIATEVLDKMAGLESKISA